MASLDVRTCSVASSHEVRVAEIMLSDRFNKVVKRKLWAGTLLCSELAGARRHVSQPSTLPVAEADDVEALAQQDAI